MPPERPEISDPAVVRRLSLDPPEFQRFVVEQAARLGSQSAGEAQLCRAYSYPYERLGFSFLVAPGRVYPIVEAVPESALETQVVDGKGVLRAAEVGEVAAVVGGRPEEPERFPLLAYGANVSVEGIAAKISGLGGHDSILPVVIGDLLDFDVVYSAHLTMYGALPATVHPCAGVRTPVAVLLATVAQVTAIARLEVNYRFGWLSGTGFVSPSTDISGDLYAFVSRHGSFAPGGGPLALAAVESASRSFSAATEKQALRLAAGLVGCESADELVHRTVDDYEWAVRQRPGLAEHSLAFEAPGWVEFAA